MLNITSKELKDLAAVSGEWRDVKGRSAGTVAVSTAVGVGMVWAGTHQARRRHNNWWHVLTAVGVANLVTNGADIVNRAAK
jgi:hypothetical protein